MIRFTQFVRPHGHRREGGFERSAEIEQLAADFERRGGWFEAEVLTTGEVSLTACRDTGDGPDDVAIEVVENGPSIGEAVDRLVRAVAV